MKKMLNSTATPLTGLSSLSGPPYFVDLHVNPGESVSIQLFDGNETVLRGPATITMISQHTFPPIPMPVQVPPGHMIQQIVDENGQLRQIILSAHPNGNSNTPNNAIMPQQHQQQPSNNQPFPYCCCCSYSCMGTPQTAPMPQPLPPPPPPQSLRHNILTFPTQTTRRNHSFSNRTYSPAVKRSAQTYLNNNSIGKSPIRHKLNATPGASVDGVTKVSFSNNKLTTPDSKPYEFNTNRVVVGRMAQNETDCLSFSDSKNAINKTFNTVNKQMIAHSINDKELIESNGPILSAPRPAPPFSYTRLDEHNHQNHQLNHSIDNCSHFESSDKPILLEINLSSNDSRVSNNINEDIVEEDEDEEEVESHGINEQKDLANKYNNQNKLDFDNNLLNKRNDNEIETLRLKEQFRCQTHESHEESLSNELNDNKSEEDCNEVSEQTNDKNLINIRNSNTLNEIETNSCISNVMQDNQHDVNLKNESNEQSFNRLQTNLFTDLLNDSINQNENDLNKSEVDKEVMEIDENHELSSDENHTKESISKLSDDENEDLDNSNKLVTDNVVPTQITPQRSPKHLLPQLELLNLTYTSLTANTVKLKWTHTEPHSSGDNLYAKHFVVEMLPNKWTAAENEPVSGSQPNGTSFRVVYQGHSNNCRISHLTSQQQYSFRVRTTCEEHLVVSNVLTITTPEQQPINNKYNKKSRREILQQQIQQQQQQIHQQQLLLQQQQHLQQNSNSTNTEKSEPTISSDQRCAILLLLLFTLFALIVAVLIQQLLSDN
ncbi:putative uncharacterized protein DDB_G0288537 [Oppia nitens]|uniref:putative uncharacterized protein DDB_G0288537 n=1 Tax=Oppia nitens TaxID=1686743 RepID=UPI0023DB12AE|nr:putative uncharacterized protein DDB_G0288537 [Oppia nitens]